MKRIVVASWVALLLPSVAGCHAIAGTNDFSYEDIVGSWESIKASPGGGRHSATVYGDGTGEGSLHIGSDDSRYLYYDVELSWLDRGGSYEVDVWCADVGCEDETETQFQTLCSFLPDQELLDCEEADAGLQDGELTFRRTDD
ncbi:MAG: hypothetical protein JRI23_28505 [Deltaproteobacteria bacterium]|jgi:hypothetical protein|nr:hypothetical protein [Deltaproteobacteria bacterium]MBW2536041.1 hypothetical protein [Deltaproteobacteria bacterium]